jgi:C4-dicarboxylate-specific signal transduction histidine kinase
MELSELTEYAEKLKILYVEDYEPTREQVAKLLDTLFENVTIAIDGCDGVTKFQDSYNKKEPFDVILTDISMPNKNGIDMIKDIQKINKEINVIILSAHSDTEFFIDAIKLNVDGFLIKPLDIDHLLDGLSKIIKKIKYNEAIEKERQLKDQLLIQQSKLAMMGEMIDSIAHQWRQPLNSIGSITTNLIFKSRMGMQLNPDNLLDSATDIEEQVTFMNTTLKEFREFFRPSSNKVEIKISDNIESIKRLLKDNIIKNSLKIEITGDKDTIILINENELKHIFINLITNAIDEFNKNNIEHRLININISNQENYIIIQIEDNAGGIPTEIIDKLFDINFTTKKEIGGTGIGLYMTQNIINKNNGSITVENKDDGALFTIKFDKKV